MMGAVKDFMQTVNFCRHVLGMSGGDALTTPWISGIVRGAQFVCKERKQSRVLTAQEVLTLECILIDGRFSLTDRYGAGCILFLLYSRARVSDVRNVSSHFADIVEGSARAGFIEVHTFDHKSVRVTAALGTPLILVAPVFGLSDASWGKAFVQVCADIGLPLGGNWTGPLFRAPSPAGDLTGRPIKTDEVRKWASRLVETCAGSFPEGFTAHGIKATPLSWLAKYGVGEEARHVLGHRSMTGKKALVTYSRDLQSAPLRTFCEVLDAVRRKIFLPDATRSGMISLDKDAGA